MHHARFNHGGERLPHGYLRLAAFDIEAERGRLAEEGEGQRFPQRGIFAVASGQRRGQRLAGGDAPQGRLIFRADLQRFRRIDHRVALRPFQRFVREPRQDDLLRQLAAGRHERGVVEPFDQLHQERHFAQGLAAEVHRELRGLLGIDVERLDHRALHVGIRAARRPSGLRNPREYRHQRRRCRSARRTSDAR